MFIGRFVSSHIPPHMSLPNATKDTTEHPPKNAVAAPVNKQEKAADVDRKVLSFMYLSLTLLLTLLLPLASILWCHSGFPSRTLSLQRPIAQGESSSVYSACATPTIASQFRPPTPTSLASAFPKRTM